MLIKHLVIMTTITGFSMGPLSAVTAADKHSHEHEHEYRQHGSHVHGIASLNLAAENGEIHIELDSPAANIVGFEHRPSSEVEHAALDKAVAKLKQGSQLFAFNASAGCSLEKAQVESALLQDNHGHHQHDHDKQDDKKHADSHSDIEVSYHFECSNPGDLSQLTVGLFEAFSGMGKLNVQYITDTGQGAAELTPASHVIAF